MSFLAGPCGARARFVDASVPNGGKRFDREEKKCVSIPRMSYIAIGSPQKESQPQPPLLATREEASNVRLRVGPWNARLRRCQDKILGV